ncbi:hypothetical protein AVEN_7041-1 [Araneus ventricosus]|uniref:Uncharacterized protein n=1 Tax=Araneus ventricosus TaxID=182803 RepID=A0A4Y2Q399_ARAVE|nr:hypothetical protein AVEN_7041-1 [Araneus ventricosus]
MRAYPTAPGYPSVTKTNTYKKDERGVRRALSRTVHHISVVSALLGRTPPHDPVPEAITAAERLNGHGTALLGRTRKHQGLAHVVTNSAIISAVDELIRQERRITTREIAVKLSICKGTMHHIIHKKLGYGNVCAQWVPRHL